MADLKYKGFTGSANVSVEDGCLHGRILFIDDIITYEGATVDELLGAFQESIDSYLAYCDRTGKAPNKPYSGSFNVRIGPELHQKAAEEAHKQGIKLNVFVYRAIQDSVGNNGIAKVEHILNHIVTLKDEVKSETRIATTKSPVKWEQMHVYATH